MKIISAHQGLPYLYLIQRNLFFLLYLDEDYPFPYVSIDILFPNTFSNFVFINLEIPIPLAQTTPT